nr:uncharacterized protein LOC117692190 [Crassostrea gigas]
MKCRSIVSTYVPILVSCLYFTFSSKNCDRSGVCCPGYKWNKDIGNCTECNIGYSGLNCSKQCVYPSYGWKCTLECKCSKEYCNSSMGCENKTTWEQDIHTSAGASGPLFIVMIICFSVSAILLLVFKSLKCWKHIKCRSTVKEDVTEENHYQTISDHDLFKKLSI